MDESECTESEGYSAGRSLPATRDWLHHANQSLSRLKEVKKTSYRLGGGPREREVNCQCNYRSKSKSSYLSLDAEPPQLAVDSQETASMPDLSIPEIVRQFNERQLQKDKQKRRPHSSSVYASTKSATEPNDGNSKKPSYNYNAFITVKGQTVTPQVRPPHGPQQITDGRKDDTAYKGLLYLDQQPVEHQKSTLEGLRKYSAAFGDDEDDPSDIPPPPRVSPEPGSPKTNSPECLDSDELFSEDDDNGEIINNSSETRSLSSAGHRSLVFAIPTAGSEGGSDDDYETTPEEFIVGRLSADYVAKSETLLGELNKKSQAETAELSDMFQDMENAKEKISNLRISPRDLELESRASSQRRDGGISPHPVRGADTPSVHVVNVQIGCSPVEDATDPSDGLYETFWVEEPVDRYMPNALPLRTSRVCSARYMNQHATDPARVRKHQSESSLVLKGKTVEFFNSEDLAARTNLRDLRRTSEPNKGSNRLSSTGGGSGILGKNVSRTEKVSTKPPLSRWNSTKSNKKQTSKQKHPSDNKNSKTDNRSAKSSLRKSISDGNIHLSVMSSELLHGNNALKKSVTFSQDVLSQDCRDLACGKVDNSLDIPEQLTSDMIDDKTAAKRAHKSCLWTHPGVVIQNGLEMEEADLKVQDSPEPVATNQVSREGHVHPKTQSTRAKLLAKMKEISCEEEPCACRTVTRPTAALLAESKNGRLGKKETSSRNEKLLKSRPTRPYSAPIKRPSGSSESTVERPKSPRKPRASSATVQRKRTASEEAQSRPRPSSAHVGRIRSKDARRSRAAAQVLKEGYLFKERPPPPLPPGLKEREQKKDVKGNVKEENNNSRNSWNKEEDDVAASEECQEVFARLQEKGIDVSMDTIKRGLMAPARKANDYNLATMGATSGLLSRPENWLPEEHARVQIWENVLKSSK